MRKFVDLSPDDQVAVKLALGRLFQLISRPEQPADADDYEQCRRVLLDVAGDDQIQIHRPNWARDRLKGAQGD